MFPLVPDDDDLFGAIEITGVAYKTVTAPLDRVKLLMQTHGLRVAPNAAKKEFGFIEAFTLIGKEGVKGYWKGNLPQVIRVIPYSAVQLFAYETYKEMTGNSLFARLAAVECVDMTSTLVTYTLDVLLSRLAVAPGYRTTRQVAVSMLKEEGLVSFYNGLVPTLFAIGPFVAVNFCTFNLVKKSLPEKYERRSETLVAATVATLSVLPTGHS